MNVWVEGLGDSVCRRLFRVFLSVRRIGTGTTRPWGRGDWWPWREGCGSSLIRSPGVRTVPGQIKSQRTNLWILVLSKIRPQIRRGQLGTTT